MHNQPGRGPTSQSKTQTRMRQERASPGMTTAGGNETDRPNPKAGTDPTLSVAGRDLETSDNSASRREDAAAGSRSREDRIRDAAYRRYVERDGAGGDESADWLAAEAEIDAADVAGDLRPRT